MKNTNHSFKTLFTVLVHISRIVLGAVFVFSGFVKAIDPLGYTFKIEEYLTAFGGFFEIFAPLSFLAAIAFSALELLIGLNLLFSVQLKWTGVLTLLFMLFYTPLTFYIWLENPVTDCGCFGDALLISNGATFAKNVVLLFFAILLLIALRGRKSFWLPRMEFAIMSVFIIFGVGLQIYSYQHLPMKDFRPYKVGVNILQAMELPEGAAHDVYETTFLYEKNGVTQEFTLENYPAGDSTWTFVDQNTKLIVKGDEPEIKGFTITDENGYEITDLVLEYEGYNYLLSIYDLKKASIKGMQIAEKFYQEYKNTNVKFYALTSASSDEIEEFKEKAGITFPFYQTDATQLKTMIRANPGLVLIKNGTIEGKWNWRDFE